MTKKEVIGILYSFIREIELGEYTKFVPREVAAMEAAIEIIQESMEGEDG